MKTEKIIIKSNYKTVEELKAKIAEVAPKHNLEFLLEYEIEQEKDENGETVFAVKFDDEMDICLEVLDWIKDETNYGSVCQLDSFIRQSERENAYKDDWNSMIGEYVKTRNVNDIEPILSFDPNDKDADPEWKENLVSYVEMVADVYDFLLS